MNNEPAPSLETQLANAEDALAQWEERDLRRSGGSIRQDLIHDTRGEELRREVARLSNPATKK
ncbi:hypothetical protein [Klebsiella oxytoca]|uniref:hypothetical protein n=1 Tax=Klebsiella oxytoca TaxID=571 RepID=UPI001CCD6FE1|nr:hypothetical protein [Klebsiella oxytoca]MBZ7306581.1 hypothetical protein [Klebsiella oxytoca]